MLSTQHRWHREDDLDYNVHYASVEGLEWRMRRRVYDVRHTIIIFHWKCDEPKECRCHFHWINLSIVCTDTMERVNCKLWTQWRHTTYHILRVTIKLDTVDGNLSSTIFRLVDETWLAHTDSDTPLHWIIDKSDQNKCTIDRNWRETYSRPLHKNTDTFTRSLWQGSDEGDVGKRATDTMDGSYYAIHLFKILNGIRCAPPIYSIMSYKQHTPTMQRRLFRNIK